MVSYDRKSGFQSVGITVSTTPDSGCNPSRYIQDEMVYCRNLLDKLGLDEDEIINAKMTQNEAKYPVEKARGSAAKYDQLTDDKETEG